MGYKNIAISGDISTGKSTLARNLAAKLGWEYISSGNFIRQWHKDHNISLDAPDKVPQDVDNQLDFGLQQKMKDEAKVVFESHLGGWLAKDLPETFKVLCVSNFEVRMERASKRDGVSLKAAKKDSKKRAGLLIKKFKQLYGVDNSFDPRYFDLVVDTTIKNPEQVMKEVLKKITEPISPKLFPNIL